MKAIVIGTGTVGSAVTKALEEKGHEVVSVGRKSGDYQADISDPTFLATPAIVPTPNSYSRRISSNSSTLALHSNGLPLPGKGPNQGIRSLPRWATLNRRTGPNQSTEITN